MTKLCQEHKITVTCMCSDHDKFTAGGSVSNHHFGRGMDIGAIDGEIVGPGIAAGARGRVRALDAERGHAAERDRLAVRDRRAGLLHRRRAPEPPAHRLQGGDHRRTGSRRPTSPRRRAGRRAGRPVAPVASAAAAARGAAPRPPRRRRSSRAPVRDSQMFQAVGQGVGGRRRAAATRSDSQMFLKAVEAPKASAAAAAPGAGRAAPAAGASRAAAGRGAAVDAAAVAAAAPDAYPGDSAPREQIAAWMAGQAREARAAAAAAADGLAGRVGDEEPQLRRRRLASGSSRCASGSGTRAPTPATPRSPSCRSSGSSIRPRRSSASGSPRASRSTDPNQFGEWIADVERPAAQYRGRYQTKLEEANGLLASRARAAAPPRAVAPPRRSSPPAAAGERRRGVGGAELPPEILAPLQEAIAAGNAPGPEGDGGDPGSDQVHRHRLQVGRLDAADRVRLLGPDAVGLRAVRRADPARDLHADRGAERRRDRRPRGLEAGRPGVLRRQRRRPPRRHVPRRRQVPPRAAHRRRRQGLEPRASPTTRASSRAGGASTPAPASPLPAGAPAVAAAAAGGRRPPRPRRRSTRPRSPRPRPRSPATPPRSAATTRSSSRRSRPSSPARTREQAATR